MIELDSRNLKNPLPDGLPMPDVVERSTFEAALSDLRVREKAHTREGDAIARRVGGCQWWKWTQLRG